MVEPRDPNQDQSFTVIGPVQMHSRRQTLPQMAYNTTEDATSGRTNNERNGGERTRITAKVKVKEVHGKHCSPFAKSRRKLPPSLFDFDKQSSPRVDLSLWPMW